MALLTVILMLWAVIIVLKSKPENPGFYNENTLPLRGLLAVLIIVHHQTVIILSSFRIDSKKKRWTINV